MQENRSDYLSAALTILRAFHVAGRPDQRISPWGSFTAWSKLVRGALVWAGLPDPIITQRRVSADGNEVDNDAHDFWLAIIDGTDGLASTICAAANASNAREVLNLREMVTPYLLKKMLHRFVDKPRAGKRIRRDRAGASAAIYFVEEIKK